MTTQRKTFEAALELKADEPGVVVARFATLGVLDKDGDVTEPGAFGSQEVRVQPYGHKKDQPSIGKGVISEQGDEAIATLRFNLAMVAGKEAYESLKFDIENGSEPLTEWSYIYDLPEGGWSMGDFKGQQARYLRRIKVHSVDPVFIGAGEGTQTISVKEDAPEPGAAKTINLPDGMSLQDFEEALRMALKHAFPALMREEEWCWLAGIYDTNVVFQPEGAGDRYFQADYTVDDEGMVIITGQPREVERIVTYEPAGKSSAMPAQTYGDHAEHVLADVQAFIARSQSLAGLKAKDGKALSDTNQARLSSLLVAMKSTEAGIESLLSDETPAPAEEPDQQEELPPTSVNPVRHLHLVQGLEEVARGMALASGGR